MLHLLLFSARYGLFSIPPPSPSCDSRRRHRSSSSLRDAESSAETIHVRHDLDVGCGAADQELADFRPRGTKVQVEALGEGAYIVRFDFPRRWTSCPGCHVHAHIPAVSLWLSHPFDVAWVERDPTEDDFLMRLNGTGRTTKEADKIKNSYLMYHRMQNWDDLQPIPQSFEFAHQDHQGISIH